MEIPEPLQKYGRPEYWWRRAGLPVPLLDVTFESVEENGLDPDIVDYGRQILDVWEDGGWQGIALFGPPGTGKTSLTIAMAKEYIAGWVRRERRRNFFKLMDAWPPAIFTTLTDYHHTGFEQMSAEKMIDRAPEEWNVLAEEWVKAKDRREYLRHEVPVLLLDDVGKEHTSRSGYTESGFYSLFRGRWSQGLVTCMTSNLTGDEFMESYGEAQVSFVHEACLVLNVDGPDFRLLNA